jgi:tetratricopeptide (TPR) repeat protein
VDADKPAAYTNRGWTYHQIGNYEQAIADYTESLRLESENASTYLNRSLAYEMKENVALAIADLERALELSDNPKMRRFIEGRLKELQGE